MSGVSWPVHVLPESAVWKTRDAFSVTNHACQFSCLSLFLLSIRCDAGSRGRLSYRRVCLNFVSSLCISAELASGVYCGFHHPILLSAPNPFPADAAGSRRELHSQALMLRGLGKDGIGRGTQCAHLLSIPSLREIAGAPTDRPG